MFDKLIEDHRRILAVVADIEALLNDTPPANPMCLSRARWALTRELTQHLALEDRVLAQHGRAGAVDGLGTRFRDYTRRWSGPSSPATWGDFRNETKALLAALKKRIAHEEQVVYPSLRAA